MKHILIVLLLFPLLIFGQASPQKGLFEVVTLKLKKGQEKAFEAAVKKHNTAFHAAGSDYEANLYYIVNGPNGGQYSWVMGPTNYTAMDTRPVDDAHNDDWSLVGEYVESAGSPTYWQADEDLSHNGTNASGSKSMVWIFDLKEGKTKRWIELVAKIKEVYAKQRPDESMRVYFNEFTDTKAGRDVAVVFPFSKWAWLDRKSEFYKDFETIHGEETWAYFISEFGDCVNGRVEYLRERID